MKARISNVLIVVSALWLQSCIGSTSSEHTKPRYEVPKRFLVRVSIIMKDTVCRADTVIRPILCVENITNENLLVIYPPYAFQDYYPVLFKGNEKQSQRYLVDPDLTAPRGWKMLHPHETMQAVFDDYLEELFDLTRPGAYTLFVDFAGAISAEDSTKLSSLGWGKVRSDSCRFVVD